MGYQTVLIYCGSKPQVKALVDAGLKVAAKSDRTHIIGLHVIPQVPVYPDMAFMVTSEIVEMQRSALLGLATDVQNAFENQIKNSGVSWEWRCVDAGGSMIANYVLAQALCADLIIGPQDNPDSNSESQYGISEQVMMSSGRPVLIVPYAGEFKNIGQRIMIAWNASREAARATFDAMPLLKRAESVDIMWSNPQDENISNLDLPSSEIATTLARHDVKANTFQTVNSEIRFSEELLSRISDKGCDLLVMGGYGHSRFREFVFGGATRGILQHMTVPVLMSH